MTAQETRWQLVGFDGQGILTVRFTLRRGWVRVIGAGYDVLSQSTVAKKWKELAFSGPSYDQVQKGEKIQLVPLRGGVREGAGRKRSGHVRLQLSISPATRKKIEAIAKLKKISLSQAVEQLAAAV